MTQTLVKAPDIVSASPIKKARKFWLISVLEFTAVLVLALVALDPILSLAGVGDDEIIDVDPVTGWSLMPNRSFTYRKEGFSHTTINSVGMRDLERPFNKPEGTIRIAVFGDSLTEGLEVPFKQTYCHVLEEQLNAQNTGHKFEVLNFGAPKYSLGQQYLKFKQLGVRFDPDLVIFTARSEAIKSPPHEHGYGRARPEFTVGKNGELIEDRSSQKEWFRTSECKRMIAVRWLRFHSRLWGLIGVCNQTIAMEKESLSQQLRILHQWLRHPLKPMPAANSMQMASTGAQFFDTAQDQAKFWQEEQAIIEQANRECVEQKRRFALLSILRTDRTPHETELLKNFAEKSSVNFLDLNQLPVMPGNDSADLFNIKHYAFSHYSRTGHQFMGTQLAASLKGGGLLDRLPESTRSGKP